MHGWLTLTLNQTGGFQGWHGWHQDGPAPLGRYHKAFVMISKNRSTLRGGSRAVAAHTNLAAVPASARYAHNCAFRSRHPDYHDPQALLCNTQMLPGDVLFFREDVWHRTQDALLDRVALILDIYRVPLRHAPVRHIQTGSELVHSARANEMSEWSRQISKTSKTNDWTSSAASGPYSPTSGKVDA